MPGVNSPQVEQSSRSGPVVEQSQKRENTQNDCPSDGGLISTAEAEAKLRVHSQLSGLLMTTGGPAQRAVLFGSPRSPDW